MTDAPTEAGSGRETSRGGDKPRNGVERNGVKPDHGDERRRGDRRSGDRRSGERRIAERRRGLDTAEAEAAGKSLADADSRVRDHNLFWYDFIRFNLTGWSVVIPTLAGLAIGNWIDNRYPAGFSWALALMAIGLFLGCLNAWYWIRHHDDGGGGDRK